MQNEQDEFLFSLKFSFSVTRASAQRKKKVAIKNEMKTADVARWLKTTLLVMISNQRRMMFHFAIVGLTVQRSNSNFKMLESKKKFSLLRKAIRNEWKMMDLFIYFFRCRRRPSTRQSDEFKFLHSIFLLFHASSRESIIKRLRSCSRQRRRLRKPHSAYKRDGGETRKKKWIKSS